MIFNTLCWTWWSSLQFQEMLTYIWIEYAIHERFHMHGRYMSIVENLACTTRFEKMNLYYKNIYWPTKLTRMARHCYVLFIGIVNGKILGWSQEKIKVVPMGFKGERFTLLCLRDIMSISIVVWYFFGDHRGS